MNNRTYKFTGFTPDPVLHGTVWHDAARRRMRCHTVLCGARSGVKEPYGLRHQSESTLVGYILTELSLNFTGAVSS